MIRECAEIRREGQRRAALCRLTILLQKGTADSALLYLAHLRFLLLGSDSGVHGPASESGGFCFKSFRVSAFALAQRLSQSQFCAFAFPSAQ